MQTISSHAAGQIWSQGSRGCRTRADGQTGQIPDSMAPNRRLSQDARRLAPLSSRPGLSACCRRRRTRDCLDALVAPTTESPDKREAQHKRFTNTTTTTTILALLALYVHLKHRRWLVQCANKCSRSSWCTSSAMAKSCTDFYFQRAAIHACIYPEQ